MAGPHLGETLGSGLACWKGTNMLESTHVVGIDPGLVHTGLVRISFWPHTRLVIVNHEAIAGPDSVATEEWIYNGALSVPDVKPVVWVEGYRPRSNLNTDQRMVNAVKEFASIPGARVLLNYGVKKVVKQPLMELLGVWKFSTPTHHDDLRSAARIALLGMLKDKQHNSLLTQIVKDHLDGRSWSVNN